MRIGVPQTRLQIKKKKERSQNGQAKEKIRRLTGGFKTGAYFCKNQGSNLITEFQGMLSLWRENFSNMLNANESAKPADGELESLIEKDGIDIPIPNYKEVRIAFARPARRRGLMDCRPSFSNTAAKI